MVTSSSRGRCPAYDKLKGIATDASQPESLRNIARIDYKDSIRLFRGAGLGRRNNPSLPPSDIISDSKNPDIKRIEKAIACLIDGNNPLGEQEYPAMDDLVELAASAQD